MVDGGVYRLLISWGLLEGYIEAALSRVYGFVGFCLWALLVGFLALRLLA
jgi:hypothetical protein